MELGKRRSAASSARRRRRRSSARDCRNARRAASGAPYRPRDRAKSKTGVRRPLQPYNAVLLVAVHGNIQNPTSRRPRGKRAKVRYGLCPHWYAVFNLDRRLPGAAAETSSHLIQGFRCVFHRPFCIDHYCGKAVTPGSNIGCDAPLALKGSTLPSAGACRFDPQCRADGSQAAMLGPPGKARQRASEAHRCVFGSGRGEGLRRAGLRQALLGARGYSRQPPTGTGR